ncbi:MAG: hypothetical protein KKE20_01805 [Nanoarchaeota archaeon]|nr:hypothetical protein [Nanoarchaeota archaeon]
MEYDLEQMFIRQQYAKRILDYLTLVIVEQKREKIKGKKRSSLFGALNPIIHQIERVYGTDMNSGLDDFYGEPVVNKDNLRMCIRNNEIPFKEEVFEVVIQDLMHQGIIIPDSAITLQKSRSISYIINTRILGTGDLEEKVSHAKDAINDHLVKYVDDVSAKKILRYLLMNSDTRIFTFGYLGLRIFREEGIHIDDYKSRMAMLEGDRIVTSGEHRNLGKVKYLNPLLKPYEIILAVTRRIVEQFEEQPLIKPDNNVIILKPEDLGKKRSRPTEQDNSADIIYLFGEKNHHQL